MTEKTQAQIFADLIEAGPELPQCKFELFRFDEDQLTECCVNGRAMLGAGYVPKNDYSDGWDEIAVAFGYASTCDLSHEYIQYAAHPLYPGDEDRIISICADLNNEGGWTFAQIVEWLRSLPTS